MGRKGFGKSTIDVLGSNREHSGREQVHVTAGGILTPVLGFKGPGITGTPPKPEARGFTNYPGDGAIPGGKGRKAGGNDALKAFGLNGSGKNDQ